MMTQEDYVDVLEMRAQGLTFEEIGDELGMHPARPVAGGQSRQPEVATWLVVRLSWL